MAPTRIAAQVVRRKVLSMNRKYRELSARVAVGFAWALLVFADPALAHRTVLQTTLAPAVGSPSPLKIGSRALFQLLVLRGGQIRLRMSDVLEWAVANLGSELTVEVLARHAHVSPRTFARRFKAAVGETPLQWVLHQRVLASRRLLESTDLGIDAIASRVGFGSAASLRVHFGRVVGTSPAAYRSAFCAA